MGVRVLPEISCSVPTLKRQGGKKKKKKARVKDRIRLAKGFLSSLSCVMGKDTEKSVKKSKQTNKRNSQMSARRYPVGAHEETKTSYPAVIGYSAKDRLQSCAWHRTKAPLGQTLSCAVPVAL